MSVNLFTYVERKALNPLLTLHDRFFVIGSCFADGIGKRLSESGINTCCNPFGTTYNPLSICSVIERLNDNRPFAEEKLFYANGLYHSFLHHGSFSTPDKQRTLNNINIALHNGAEALRNADVVIITLGTAWVYELVEQPATEYIRNSRTTVVNNCHKLPATHFQRRLLSTTEIHDNLKYIIQTYLNDKRIIFTVSPIRHKADGLHGNTISKSTLQLAINNLIAHTNHNITYFPAYEILLDELRDYRWYSDDLCHPSNSAAEYIWEIFRDWSFTKESVEAMGQVSKYKQLLNHRPIHCSPENIAALKEKQQALKQQLETKYRITL